MILDFRPKLGNRCKVFPVYTLFRASILDFRPRLGNRCKGGMVSPTAAVATTRSVSDSNLRSCKEEWPACRGCRDNDLPRPILFFVAARKNGSACSGCRDNDVSRPILIFVAAKKNGPPAVHPQRQPKSRLRLVSCCSDS